MNSKNLNQILLLLTYCATQHDTINAMKRPHAQISNIQQNKQLPPAFKKTKLDTTTTALLCTTICNKNFSQSFNLTVHTIIHTEGKPYICNICDKRFSQTSHLSTHQKIHTGEKPYTCNICHKTFAYTWNLTRHARTHTGEKPYECNMCNKSFGTSGNLIDHQRIHTGEKPYTCNICNKKFAQIGHLTGHKKTHIKAIAPQTNLLNNNAKYMPTQITENITLKSFDTPTDSQDILDNIMTFNDTVFNEWIGQ